MQIPSNLMKNINIQKSVLSVLAIQMFFNLSQENAQYFSGSLYSMYLMDHIDVEDFEFWNGRSWRGMQFLNTSVAA